MNTDDCADASEMVTAYTNNAIRLGSGGGDSDTYLSQRDALVNTLAAALEEAKDGSFLDRCLDKLRALTLDEEGTHA